MRKARTTTELMHGWEGLDYSFRQLVWSGVLLSERVSFACVAARGEAQLIEPWIRNALIESFLVNARRMAWFLKSAPPDDVYASDYLPGWQPWKPAGPLIGKVSEVLTHAKYAGKPEPYKFETIFNPIDAGMRSLAATLDDCRSPWFSRFNGLVELLDAQAAQIRDL